MSEDQTRLKQDLPLIAIGASAGGLEPLERFFSEVSEHPGAAFVVIQHLSPDYRSMMNELLARKSKLRIVHIEDGMPLAADTVYLIRPEMFAELRDGVFRTQAYAAGDGLPHLPIDRFFASLVHRSPEKTIAIVLSGSGSDGAAGARLLHERGAAVLVQTPQDAAFTSMPRAVLISGCVDNVLSVEDMPSLIEDVLRDGKGSVAVDAGSAGNMMARILKRLEARHKVDFTAYKLSSVHRRVMRRLHLRGHVSLEDYERVLTEREDVLDELFEDMLIGVTEFYRDPDAIAQLRHTVLDPLIQRVDTQSPPLKIWVPACSTGQEVYTLAIEISEALRAAKSTRGFRIIGTDVHAAAIEYASRGVYSEEQLVSLPATLRDRYFDKVGQKYSIDPVLRQKIIFSHHNLISDPPFINLDLISCRNLLIYLQDEAQAGVISMFLFGLKTEAALFLGASESLGKFASAFDVEDARWRIFRKRPMSKTDVTALMTRRDSSVAHFDTNAQARRAPRTPRKPYQSEIQDLRSRDGMIRAYDALLKTYAPTSILITSDGRVLTWFGRAGELIDTMSNLADWTVQDIVHPSLHLVISVGIEKLQQGHALQHERRVALTLADGTQQDVAVVVETLTDAAGGSLLLVKIDLREDETGTEAQEATTSPADATDEDANILSRRIHVLERDLRLTEETLQHVTERLEASGEELQASNEELQASNEELQASNEELQSSNEELHAVNEELVSLSGEHERKIELLQELGANTEIVLKMLGTGLITIDADRKIRRFSELVEQAFLLQQHDLGRALATVGPRLEFADLSDMADAVEKDGSSLARTGQHNGRELNVEAHVPTAEASSSEIAVIFLFQWT